jgi:hypothetical protein
MDFANDEAGLSGGKKLECGESSGRGIKENAGENHALECTL